MYPQKFSKSIISSQPNLKFVFKENSHYLVKCTFMIRQNLQCLKNVNEVHKKLENLIKNGRLYKMFSECPRPKNHRNSVLKVWVHHCECVVAQRLRRCQQMFCLYSKWWEEHALKELINKMRQSLTKKGKEFALGAVGISTYNWDQNRIPIEEVKQQVKEFEYINVLKENTICLSCDPTKRTNINTNICKCGTAGKPSSKSYDDWIPFIENKDLIVWRRLKSTGQYEYKVFGSYNDVSAEDFLNVQIDIDYRRKWDTTAVALEVAETDPALDSNSDILYWEMLWPRLFVNRDYVFSRRYLIDEDTNTLYIMSKSTEHHKFPKYPEKYRIEDYWSCMVIKPYTDMKKPGIEFILTYYDNPGVNIPSSVTTWVAMRAMPDFLGRLRQATKKYREYCIKEGISKHCRIIAEEERIAEEKRQRDKLDYCSYEYNEDTSVIKAVYPRPDIEKAKKISDKYINSVNVNRNIEKISSEVVSTQSSTVIQSKTDNYWKYFHPMYYFN